MVSVRTQWMLHSSNSVRAIIERLSELTRTGWAFLPSSHSSALRAGMSPTVSGYKSSWNNSDYNTSKHFTSLSSSLYFTLLIFPLMHSTLTSMTNAPRRHYISVMYISVCTHWVTSVFGLVFRWVFSLSPKTNLNPEFWSQSEVRISSAKTDAKIATEYTHVVDFRLTSNIFTLYLLFCSSLSIALKRVQRKKWRNRQKES